jgi:hypothetical protein
MNRSISEFTRYADRYTSTNPDVAENIALKKEHSLRVLQEMTMLVEHESIPPALGHVAQMAALFHDVGRFEQYSRYQTFSDARSVDHARLGVEVLRGSTFLDLMDPGDRKIVLRAIELHNKPVLPPLDDPRERTVARLLRDADKLDIFRIMIDYYAAPRHRNNQAIEFGLPAGALVTPSIIEALHARKPVRYTDVRTQNDFRLIQIGWVYDLNFPHSFRRIAERCYLDAIRGQLPDLPEVERLYRQACQYVHRGAAQAR